VGLRAPAPNDEEAEKKWDKGIAHSPFRPLPGQSGSGRAGGEAIGFVGEGRNGNAHGVDAYERGC
jgi:hypothetical protein